MKLSIAHFVPDPAPLSDFLFYFYHHAEAHGRAISSMATQIEQMDKVIQRQLEQELDLQLLMAPRDGSGNVCYADAPDLRPEFRTTFGPIDLWNYYYALLHTRSFWKSQTTPGLELPWPVRDLFWDLSPLGRKLRRIHSSKVRTERYPFEMHIYGDRRIHPVSERFLSESDQSETGRLYLNDQDYIGGVPRRAWKFQLADQSFLPDYVERRVGYLMNPADIQSMLEWIVVVDRTCGISETLDNVK